MSLSSRILLRALAALLAITAMTTVSYAQKHTVQLRDVPIKTVVDELQRQYGYSVVIQTSQVDLNKTVSVNVTNGSIEEILKQVFSGQAVSFKVDGKNIQISKSETPIDSPSQGSQTPPAPASLSPSLGIS